MNSPRCPASSVFSFVLHERDVFLVKIEECVYVPWVCWCVRAHWRSKHDVLQDNNLTVTPQPNSRRCLLAFVIILHHSQVWLVSTGRTENLEDPGSLMRAMTSSLFVTSLVWSLIRNLRCAGVLGAETQCPQVDHCPTDIRPPTHD